MNTRKKTEQIKALCWFYVGAVLVLCLCCVGSMLLLCWFYVGSMLVLCWFCVGSVLLGWLSWLGEPLGGSWSNPAGSPTATAIKTLYKNHVEIPKGIPN